MNVRFGVPRIKINCGWEKNQPSPIVLSLSLHVLAEFICLSSTSCVLIFYSQTMQKIEEENARLKGHQNPAQKLQHLLAIKKENNALKEVSYFRCLFKTSTMCFIAMVS